MNSRILFGAILALALSVGLSSRALAQKPDNKTEPATQQPAATQPDNDNAAVPAAQQPAVQPDRDDMAKPAAQDQDRDKMSKPEGQDADRDRVAGQRGDNDINRQEVATFDSFLDSHPKIARDVRENPSRVNDAGWVSNHPELKEFLENHPKIREELKENPQAFMHREKRLDNTEKH
jgi:hypothetical protein